MIVCFRIKMFLFWKGLILEEENSEKGLWQLILIIVDMQLFRG